MAIGLVLGFQYYLKGEWVLGQGVSKGEKGNEKWNSVSQRGDKIGIINSFSAVLGRPRTNREWR